MEVHSPGQMAQTFTTHQLGFRRLKIAAASSQMQDMANLAGLVEEEAMRAEMSETATVELQQIALTEKLLMTGQEHLRELYFTANLDSEPCELREELPSKLAGYIMEAGSHVAMVAASVVAPDASSILCSSQLYRSLAKLFDILHKLDALRDCMYRRKYPEAAKFSQVSPFTTVPEPKVVEDKALPASTVTVLVDTTGHHLAVEDENDNDNVLDGEPEEAKDDSAGSARPNRKLNRAKSLWKKLKLSRKKIESERAASSRPSMEAASQTGAEAVSTPRLKDFQPAALGEQNEAENIQDSDNWTKFLAEPWSAVFGLSQHLQGVPYAHVFLSQMCQQLLSALTNKDNHRPLALSEVQSTASALSVALVLLHNCAGATEGKLDMSLGPRKILKCIKTIRLHAVVPLYGDAPLCMMNLLFACPTISIQGDISGSDWSLLISAELIRNDAQIADKQLALTEHIKAAQLAYHSFLQTFQIFALQVEELPPDDRLFDVRVITTGLHLWLTSFGLISHWKQLCHTFLAWSEACWTSEDGNIPLRSDDLEMLARFLGLIKGLGDVILEATWLQAHVNAATCAHMQHLVYNLLPAWSRASSSTKVQKALNRLQSSLQYWPGVETSAGDETPRSRGFKAILKASMLKLQNTDQSLVPEATAVAGNSMLSGELTTAVNALQAAVGGQIPIILQAPIGASPAMIQSTAPSTTQLFHLTHCLEECLKEDPTGNWKSKVTSGGWSTAKRKEIEIFLVMTTQWIHNLDIQSSVEEALQMGELLMGDIYKNIGPSEGLPYRLSVSDLMSQLGGPAETSLLPIVLYNDALEIVLANRQTHLLPKLVAQASAALDRLLDVLAREVFRHYKGYAALSLTDPSIASQCKVLWPLTVYRSFEGLLATSVLPVLDQNVEISRALSERLAIRIRQNAEHLIQSYEESHVSSLCELRSLLSTLEAAHAQLCTQSDLPSWLSMLAAADGSNSFSLITSRVANHTTLDVIQDLLLYYRLDTFTGRFVPGPKATPAATLRQDTREDFTWGPGGSKRSVFGNWCQRHADFFGKEHLDAFVHLAGRGGVAMFVEAITNHIVQLSATQLSQDLINLQQQLEDLPAQLAGVQNASFKNQFQALRSILPEAIGDGLQKEIMLRNLTELGNAISLLALLDQVLAVNANSAFLLAAPQLGITVPTSARLAVIVDDQMNPAGPLQKAANQLAYADENTQPNALNGLPTASLAQCVEKAHRSAWNESKCSSLLPGVFGRLQNILAEKLLSLPGNGATLASVLSAIIFNLCLPTAIRDGTVGLKSKKGKPAVAMTSEWQERGDGAVVGTVAVACLLDQTQDLSLVDCVTHMLKTSQYEQLTNLSQEEQAMLDSARKLQHVMTSTKAMLRGSLPERQPPSVIVAGKAGANPVWVPADLPPFRGPTLETQAYQAYPDPDQHSYPRAPIPGQDRRSSMMRSAVASNLTIDTRLSQEQTSPQRSPLTETRPKQMYAPVELAQSTAQEAEYYQALQWQDKANASQPRSGWERDTSDSHLALTGFGATIQHATGQQSSESDLHYPEGLASWQAKSRRDSFNRSQQTSYPNDQHLAAEPFATRAQHERFKGPNQEELSAYSIKEPRVYSNSCYGQLDYPEISPYQQRSPDADPLPKIRGSGKVRASVEQLERRSCEEQELLQALSSRRSSITRQASIQKPLGPVPTAGSSAATSAAQNFHALESREIGKPISPLEAERELSALPNLEQPPEAQESNTSATALEAEIELPASACDECQADTEDIASSHLETQAVHALHPEEHKKLAPSSKAERVESTLSNIKPPANTEDSEDINTSPEQEDYKAKENDMGTPVEPEEFASSSMAAPSPSILAQMQELDRVHNLQLQEDPEPSAELQKLLSRQETSNNEEAHDSRDGNVGDTNHSTTVEAEEGKEALCESEAEESSANEEETPSLGMSVSSPKSESPCENEPATHRLAHLPEIMDPAVAGEINALLKSQACRLSETARSDDLHSAEGRDGLSERSASLRSALGRDAALIPDGTSDSEHEISDTDSDSIPVLHNNEQKEQSLGITKRLQAEPEDKTRDAASESSLGPKKDPTPHQNLPQPRFNHAASQQQLIAPAQKAGNNSQISAADSQLVQIKDGKTDDSNSNAEDVSNLSETRMGCELAEHIERTKEESSSQACPEVADHLLVPKQTESSQSPEQLHPNNEPFQQAHQDVQRHGDKGSIAETSNDSTAHSSGEQSDSQLDLPSREDSESSSSDDLFTEALLRAKTSRRMARSSENSLKTSEAQRMDPTDSNPKPRPSQSGSESSIKAGSVTSHEGGTLASWASDLGSVLEKLSSKKEALQTQGPSSAFNLGSLFS